MTDCLTWKVFFMPEQAICYIFVGWEATVSAVPSSEYDGKRRRTIWLQATRLGLCRILELLELHFWARVLEKFLNKCFFINCTSYTSANRCLFIGIMKLFIANSNYICSDVWRHGLRHWSHKYFESENRKQVEFWDRSVQHVNHISLTVRLSWEDK